MGFVGLEVLFDLFGCDGWAFGVFVGGVADEGGEVADEEGDVVSEVGEGLEFAERDGVA